MRNSSRIVVYTDGGARPNPGEAAFGLVIFIDGNIVKGHGEYLGVKKTNNHAEYQGIICGLREILTQLTFVEDENNRCRASCTLYTDSELAVKQLNGQYDVKSADLLPLFTEALEIITEIKSYGVSVCIEHVLRSRNTLADNLVRRARAAKNRVDMELSFQIATNSTKSAKRSKS